jgi:hypothetical protein
VLTLHLTLKIILGFPLSFVRVSHMIVKVIIDYFPQQRQRTGLRKRRSDFTVFCELEFSEC